MRKGIRVLFLFLLSLLGTAVLSSVAALVTAVSLAATALIVPGTGTPNANGVSSYLENFRDYYMRDTPCVEGDCDAPYNPVTGEGLLGINYPASFWPIPKTPGMRSSGKWAGSMRNRSSCSSRTRFCPAAGLPVARAVRSIARKIDAFTSILVFTVYFNNAWVREAISRRPT